jgi:uncharacterized lipoprotein YbaY
LIENPEDHNQPDQSDQAEAVSSKKNGWLIAAFVLVVILLAAILAYAMLSVAGLFSGQQPTQPDVFITITEPTQGAMLDLTWAVSVKGEAGGLFEGNVVVQALDAAGNVLSHQPTIVDAPDAGTGGAGPWSVDLRISTEPGTQGQILAFSTSAKDGSIVAEDSVDVGYGKSSIEEELLKLEDHLWMLALLDEDLLIQNTLITLQFENFQASGLSGCNLYNTSYERSRTELNFGLVTSTAKECELPEGVMKQEATYFSALEGTTAFQIENQQLNLFNSSGTPLLVYDAIVMGNIIGPIETELPEDAVVYVRLYDVSQADAESNLIAEQVVTGVTQFPIPFIVRYNPKEIVQNHTYTIGVRIEDSSGNLLFTNPTAYHVITAGNPSRVDVVVESIQ